jgi:hypothetical protein
MTQSCGDKWKKVKQTKPVNRKSSVFKNSRNSERITPKEFRPSDSFQYMAGDSAELEGFQGSFLVRPQNNKL